jgi:hypothetical protein
MLEVLVEQLVVRAELEVVDVAVRAGGVVHLEKAVVHLHGAALATLRGERAIRDAAPL